MDKKTLKKLELEIIPTHYISLLADQMPATRSELGECVGLAMSAMRIVKKYGSKNDLVVMLDDFADCLPERERENAIPALSFFEKEGAIMVVGKIKHPQLGEDPVSTPKPFIKILDLDYFMEENPELYYHV